MEIKSKSFSEQPISENTTISFPAGIPGFEDQTQFQLFQQEDSNIVYLLQSTDNPDIAFSVAHPSHFNINYHFALSNEEEACLALDSFDELLILLILHRDDNADKSAQPTIKGSIKSPILINTRTRIGVQKFLETIEQSITLTEKNHEIEVSEA